MFFQIKCATCLRSSARATNGGHPRFPESKTRSSRAAPMIRRPRASAGFPRGVGQRVGGSSRPEETTARPDSLARRLQPSRPRAAPRLRALATGVSRKRSEFLRTPMGRQFGHVLDLRPQLVRRTLQRQVVAQHGDPESEAAQPLEPVFGLGGQVPGVCTPQFHALKSVRLRPAGSMWISVRLKEMCAASFMQRSMRGSEHPSGTGGDNGKTYQTGSFASPNLMLRKLRTARRGRRSPSSPASRAVLECAVLNKSLSQRTSQKSRDRGPSTPRTQNVLVSYLRMASAGFRARPRSSPVSPREPGHRGAPRRWFGARR